MLRHSENGLETDSDYFMNNSGDPDTCVVEVLLYTSQGNNSGGLFYKIIPPLLAEHKKVIELLVLLKLLSNDGIVVDKMPHLDKQEPWMLEFYGYRGTDSKFGYEVNFRMRTGMSFI